MKFKLLSAAALIGFATTAFANNSVNGSPSDIPSSTSSTTTGTSTTTTTTSNVPDQALMPKDGEIMQILKTINTAEIEHAKMAKKSAESKAVKDFANMMIKEHEKNSKQGMDLGKKIKVTPADNAQAMTMKEEADNKAAELLTLKGAEFDKAYIAGQIAMHEKTAEQLKDTLIPAAESAQLKSFLQQTHGHVEAHLKQARAIQASMTK